MSYKYCLIKPDVRFYNFVLKSNETYTDEHYKNFLKFIELDTIKCSLKNNRFIVCIKTPVAPENGEIGKLKNYLKSSFENIKNVSIEIITKNRIENIGNYLSKNLAEILNEISDDYPVLKNAFDINQFDYCDKSNTATIYLVSNYFKNRISKNRFSNYIEDYLCKRVGTKINVDFQVSEQTIDKIKEEIKQESKNQEQNHTSIKSNQITMISKENHQTSELIFGKDFDDSKFYAIFELLKNNQLLTKQVIICGKIFAADVRTINSKEGKIFFKHILFIDDETEVITVQFLNNKKIDIPKNIYVSVKGIYVIDEFLQNEPSINAAAIKRAPRRTKQDLSQEKRIELHLHSKMSQMDGLCDINDYIETAKYWGHKAAAVTDHGNVHIFPEFYSKCKKEGIKPILGLEGYLVASKENFKNRSNHITLLVKNKIGLKNLYKLVSESHLNYFYKNPRMPKELIAQKRDGLIIGTACCAGELYSAIINNATKEELESIAKFYDYFEIMPAANNLHLIQNKSYPEINSIEDLQNINRKICEIAKKYNKLIVATGDVHFVSEIDRISREALHIFAEYDDLDSETLLNFRTTDEMLKEFAYLGEQLAFEAVIKNPNLICDAIEDVPPIPKGFFPPEISEAKEKIIELSKDKLFKIYGKTPESIIMERYNNELNSIIDNNFSSLYYLAYLLVTESNNAGYIVGSRGSVGSSFIAYLLGITEVNPLPAHYLCPKCKHTDFSLQEKYSTGIDMRDKLCPNCKIKMLKDGFNVIFEVFVGFDKDKIPDIDLNFSGEYQTQIHRWVENYFGIDNVYKAGTISTLNEKTVYAVIKSFEEAKGNLSKAKYQKLMHSCDGVKRTTGQHPGGMIIIPKGKEIFEFTPIQYPANKKESGNRTTQFDYHKMEEQLIKLDCLGHDNPTQIKLLCEYSKIKFENIPLWDEKTTSIFSSCKTLGVQESDIGTNLGTLGIPEFNTTFVRQMLNDTLPKTMTELIRISGLSHGTNVWIDNAKELLTNKTAALKDVISTRDDILIYLSKNKIDRSTAFKIMETVRKKDKTLSEEQMNIMRENKIPEWYIQSCNKITYLFPKAHAIAYVLMAYRIAYFKVHEPLAFYASYITIESDNLNYKYLMMSKDEITGYLNSLLLKNRQDLTQKEEKDITILEVIRELKARKIKINKIDLYKSLPNKAIIQDDGIYPPLVTIEGLGKEQAYKICESRKNGEYKSYEDFCKRSGINSTLFKLLKQLDILPDLPESNQFKLF